MKNHTILFRWWLVIAVSLGIPALHAQNQGLNGQVTDAAKAVIDGARLTLTQVGTGDQRETVSNANGYYIFALLQPGKYELKVEKEGFESQTRTGITIETGSVSSVNVELAVGSVAQSVTVEADVPLLQASSAAVAHVVENKTIVNMPLIDRRSSQLTRLNGFVVQNGTGSDAKFAIAGGRGNNANYLIDGGSAQNHLLGVPTLSFDPPVESMQEFNVALGNYAAELGRSGGGVIQMTTKSGTNNFHGSAYEFFRNDALDTRSFFSQDKPVLRYNLFGASLGGPIIKNKTHFFFNYEGRRQVDATTRVLNVPTPAEIRGDFSAASYKVIDPLTGNPFPGNIIPADRLDPVGAKLASFYPVPNVPGAASGKANFVANSPSDTVVDVYVTRIDHTISENDRIFGRFLAQTNETDTPSIFPTPGTDSFGQLRHSYYYNASGTWYHNFSPTVINEARYTFSQRQFLNISAGAHTDLSQQLGLAGVNSSFFPTVNVNGLAQLGASQQRRLQTPIRSDEYTNNVTVLKGSHQIKFGFSYRYTGNLDLYSPSAGGSFVFNNVATESSLASLLLGWVNSASLLDTYPIDSRAVSYGAFIQDDWRVSPNLTINVGLRYDLDSPRWETKNRQNSFDVNVLNPVSGTPGAILFSGRNGLSKYAHNWDWNNFGPRLGFAWKPSDRWVIRGGGAVVYLGEYDQATPIVANTGFSTQGNFVSPDGGRTPAFLLAHGMPPLDSPAEADLTAGFGAVPIGQKPTTAISFFNHHRSNGYIYQASFNIQREVGRNMLVDIGYLGTFGHHLPAPQAQSINQVPTESLGPGNAQSRRPFPQYSDVSIVAADIGNSNYHGVNLGIEKRYSNGLLFRANYTFAKMIDDLESRNELAGYPGGSFANYYNRRADRGRSGNDIRHRFIWSSVYEVPFGQGKRFNTSSALTRALFGGWSVGLIAELRSGTPLSASELTNRTNSFSDGVRPDVVGDPDLSGSRSKGEQLAQWFNVNAFASPAAYRFGNAGRTFGEGPGAIAMDASLLKNFVILERTTLQFRAEAMNFLNHANFANPDTRHGSPTFGQVTSLVPGNESRIIQLGLHLKF